jgi:hypothetical protein
VALQNIVETGGDDGEVMVFHPIAMGVDPAASSGERVVEGGEQSVEPWRADWQEITGSTVEQGVGVQHLNRVTSWLAWQRQVGKGKAVAEGVGGELELGHYGILSASGDAYFGRIFRSGRNIGHQHRFEQQDPILQGQLALLQPAHQQFVRRRVFRQVGNDLIKIPMFDLQLVQLMPYLGNFVVTGWVRAHGAFLASCDVLLE